MTTLESLDANGFAKALASTMARLFAKQRVNLSTVQTDGIESIRDALNSVFKMPEFNQVAAQLAAWRSAAVAQVIKERRQETGEEDDEVKIAHRVSQILAQRGQERARDYITRAEHERLVSAAVSTAVDRAVAAVGQKKPTQTNGFREFVAAGNDRSLWKGLTPEQRQPFIDAANLKRVAEGQDPLPSDEPRAKGHITPFMLYRNHMIRAQKARQLEAASLKLTEDEVAPESVQWIKAMEAAGKLTREFLATVAEMWNRFKETHPEEIEKYKTLAAEQNLKTDEENAAAGLVPHKRISLGKSKPVRAKAPPTHEQMIKMLALRAQTMGLPVPSDPEEDGTPEGEVVWSQVE